MPRIIVTTDTPEPSPDSSILLDELVRSVHLSTGHAAAQLIERLAWAISDAEEAERSRSEQRQPRRREKPDHDPASAYRARQAIAA